MIALTQNDDDCKRIMKEWLKEGKTVISNSLMKKNQYLFRYKKLKTHP